ncbi:carboxypeptidase regulatory-like domain-containing protein [Actinoplanes sp. NPDC049265]|uniref:carboxypeptidase regulatory-like domain-containing protein n=1 Tax=Actinoplanes sp. NPDC049265 TaxID=3363902 RepID=UPI00371D86D4
MIRRVLAAVAALSLVVAGWAAPARAAAVGTVTGTFTTAAGEPIAGAGVSVYSDTNSYRGSTVTDANGHYTVTDVVAAGVKVQFYDHLLRQYAHQALDLPTAQVFPLPDGGVVTVDETQIPIGTVEGTYSDAAGRPIAGALVTAYSTDNRFLVNAETTADGRYRLLRVPAGPVKLQYNRNNLVQWAYQAADFAAADVIDVPAGRTAVVDETQLPAATIRGRVTAPGGGTPPSDFYVSAYPVGGTGNIGGTMADDGTYEISVPAGQWRIGVETDITGKQYVPQRTQFADATVFTVQVGQTADVDETLLPRGAIFGVLKANGGRTVVDRQVRVWQGETVIASQYSGDDGGYWFGGLTPGVYQVSYENGDQTRTWVPGTLHREQADEITVRAGEATEANTRDLGSATVRGRLTTPDGAPVPDVSVQIDAVPGGRSYADLTDEDGYWEADGIDPEDYRVSFENLFTDARQWAYGKTSEADARVFTLTAGSVTTVDDQWVVGNTLRVTATDAAGGGPADGFCVRFGTSPGFCTRTSTVSVPGLPAGPMSVRVVPLSSSDYLPSGPVPVTVADGGITPLTVPLARGGRVNAEVVDRATGTGRKQWCLRLVTPGTGGVPDEDDQGCTHKNGRITTYAVPAGTYQLFVSSTDSQGLGAQWVGANGGTGNQKEAAKIKVKVGRTTRLPQILLDPGGDVTGVVRDPGGAPVEKVNVGVNAWPLDSTPPFYESFTNGTFRVYSLGPYSWPLLFTSKNGVAPRQYAGATGNRYQAATVTVRPREGATLDYTLAAGGRLTGTVTTTRSFTTGRLTAVNPATGDVLAAADVTSPNRTYDMPVIGGGAVLLRWSLTGAGGGSGAWPDKVNVPRSGTKTVNLTIPED